ncbi:MAG: tetratricopeptide repeat protein, partial [Pyrinomonadaceae bacterium]
MKICFIRYVLLILVVVFVIGIKAENAFAQNSLNGLVFDTSHKPVARIDVELLDEFERLIKSTQTTSSGLYFFQSLRAGVYYVQIRTGGTNYREAKERIQLGQGNRTNQTTGGTSGGETLQVNFVLETDSRRSDTVASTNNEVVFAQNIPKEAEKSYDDALKALDKKNQAQAITELETAIRIFPTYYLALNRLGYEYIALNKFSEAESVFTKAVEINPNSFSGKSGLGIAQYKLDKKTEAVKTLGEATVLNPASVNSFL